MQKCIEKCKENRNIMWIMVIILCCLYFLRVFNLEQDLPPWEVGYYQPADEGAYCFLAINYEKFGAIAPTYDNEVVAENFVEKSFFLRNNFIGNLASILGFELLGNNYWGMRVPYLIIGALNFFVLALILLKIRKLYIEQTAKPAWEILAAFTMLCFDFMMFILTRTVETSAIRMTFVLLVYYVYLLCQEKRQIGFFIMGGLATASVFLVYVTNAFLHLACGILLLCIWKREGFKKFLHNCIWFVCGCLAVFALCEVYYILIWDTEALLNALKSVREFSTQSGYEIAGSRIGFIKSIFQNVISFFSSNVFLYNLPIAAGFVLTFPFVLYKTIKDNDDKALFLISIILSFMIQTLVVNDYIWRKFIIIYPMVIVYFLMMYYKKDEYKNLISKVFSTKKGKIIGSLHSLLVALYVVYIVWHRLYHTINSGATDCTPRFKFFICVLGLVPALVVVACFTYRFWTMKLDFSKDILFAFTSVVFVNVVLLLKFVVLNPTYSERDAMIELAQVVDGKYVIGSYQVGYGLYNDMLPVVTSPNEIVQMMEGDNEILLLDYEDRDTGMRNYLDNYIFSNSEYTAYPIWHIQRKFQTFGQKRNMCIYKIKKKNEVIKEYQDIKIVDNNQSILYNNIIGDYYDNINDDIYVDILGSIYGDIRGDIYGDIRGDIYGNIYGDIYGDIYGNIWGERYGDIHGQIKSPDDGTEESLSYEGAEGAIKKYYRKAFSEEIERELLQEYRELIREGEMTLQEVLYDILNTNEFIERYESSESYISQLYREVLGRSMNKSEFNDWIRVLQRGTTREDILEQFVFSEEFKEQCKQIEGKRKEEKKF